MGASDKINNKAKELKGKVKKKTGEITGNRRLRAEGAAEQGKAKMKQAGEKIKDTAKNLRATVKKKPK